jgi:hypothetical protein
LLPAVKSQKRLRDVKHIKITEISGQLIEDRKRQREGRGKEK